MLKYLDIIMAVSSIMLIRSVQKKIWKEKVNFGRYLRSADIHIYRKLLYECFRKRSKPSGRSGRRLSVTLYKVAKILWI